MTPTADMIFLVKGTPYYRLYAWYGTSVDGVGTGWSRTILSMN